MKGKFADEKSEAFYDDWNEGLHDGECYDGTRWYVLFREEGVILSEDEQGFVGASQYPEDEIEVAWRRCVAISVDWDNEGGKE